MKDRIIQVRKDAGISQAKFAESLNISRNFISLIETGERKPSDRTIKDICNKYGINEEWIISGSGEMKTPRTKETQIADLVAKLYGADENSFEFKLAMMLKDMPVEDWQKVKNFIRSLSDSID